MCIRDSNRLANLAAKVVHLTFKTVWIAGKKNEIADALSRRPVDLTQVDDEDLAGVEGIAMAAAVLVETPGKETRFSSMIKRMSTLDEKCRSLGNRIKGEVAWQRTDEFHSQKHLLSLAEDGVTVLMDGKIIIPEGAKLEVLKIAHRAHLGREGMLAKIRGSFHWANARGDIDEFVASCSPCAYRQKSKPAAEVARSRPPVAAFQEASADFFEHEGQMFLVFVCRLCLLYTSPSPRDS